MLALLCALRCEITGLRKQLSLSETFDWRGCHIAMGKYENKDILLAKTGVGRAKAERAAQLVLYHYPVTAVLSIGFAGALTEELEVGDIILCSRLYCANEPHNGLGSERPLFSDTNLVSAASKSGGATTRFRYGSCVTSPCPVLKKQAKLALGRRFNADIVDMESYWVAKAAAERRVPFMAIRAISDTAKGSLLARLLALCRDARCARRSLTSFTGCFLAKL